MSDVSTWIVVLVLLPATLLWTETRADAPVVTIFHDGASQQLFEGENLTLGCSVSGNPPFHVTLVGKRIFTSMFSSPLNTSNALLTQTMDPLGCQDTGVYVCAVWNSQWTTVISRASFNLTVLCSLRLGQDAKLTPRFHVSVGEHAWFRVPIYGFPAPSRMVLMSNDNSTNPIGSARHFVGYSSTTHRRFPTSNQNFYLNIQKQPPESFGFVDIVIFNVVEDDFTNYTFTADNGVGKALSFPLYLSNEGRQPQEGMPGDDEDSMGMVTISTPVIAVAIVVPLVIALIFCVRENKRQAKRWKRFKHIWNSETRGSSRSNAYVLQAPLPSSETRFPINHQEQHGGDHNEPGPIIINVAKATAGRSGSKSPWNGDPPRNTNEHLSAGSTGENCETSGYVNRDAVRLTPDCDTNFSDISAGFNNTLYLTLPLTSATPIYNNTSVTANDAGITQVPPLSPTTITNPTASSAYFTMTAPLPTIAITNPTASSTYLTMTSTSGASSITNAVISHTNVHCNTSSVVKNTGITPISPALKNTMTTASDTKSNTDATVNNTYVNQASASATTVNNTSVSVTPISDTNACMNTR